MNDVISLPCTCKLFMVFLFLTVFNPKFYRSRCKNCTFFTRIEGVANDFYRVFSKWMGREEEVTACEISLTDNTSQH